MEKNEERPNEIVLFGIRIPVARENDACVSHEKREKRKYTKSVMPRIYWTADMHRSFLRAIQQLGGPFASETSPKNLIELMGIEGLTLSQVKSHLQAYRNAIKLGKKEQGVTFHALTCPEDINFRLRRYNIPGKRFKRSFFNNNLKTIERKRDSRLLTQQGPFLMPHSRETCSHLQASQYDRHTTTFYEFGHKLQLPQSNAGLLLEDGDKSEVITLASL